MIKELSMQNMGFVIQKQTKAIMQMRWVIFKTLQGYYQA